MDLERCQYDPCRGWTGKCSFVIDDVRFRNEINYLKQFGTKFVRLERSRAVNPYKGALDDISELDLDNYKEWDYILTEPLNRNAEDLKIGRASCRERV